MGCQREKREQMDRLEQFIGTKQMVRLIYSKKGDERQYQLGKNYKASFYISGNFWERINGSEK